MSHLILDIGNTRTKAAVVREREILHQYVADGLEKLDLEGICDTFRVDKAIASVVGRKPDFASLLPTCLLPGFHLLSHESRLPITIDYDTPQTLGMDRVAAVIGARQLCENSPIVVVDAGSCITIDLLDKTDCYRGGAILPGLQMRFKALNHYTAALPLVELDDGELDGSIATPSVGKSTRASIVAGVCNAALFEIEGFINDYHKRWPDIKLFLTGGNAVFFAKRLFFPNFASPSLLTIGLDKILEMNS